MSRFFEDSSTVHLPKCNICKHHISGLKCKAFDRIPNDIVFDREEHNKVQPDQKGQYVFEEKVKRYQS
ncbi:MAG: hypothetical protein LC107_06230 [Chitinophagales bacterium]|nr:hypothetical protein [Chitinophagales bacterium]